MKYFYKLSLLLKILALAIFLQSCNSFPVIHIDCSDAGQEINRRHNLFNKISEKEEKRRSNISLRTNSQITDISVLSQIVKSIESSRVNAKIIPVDLRSYKNVPLGNIIISNIKNKTNLKLFLKTSKYSQETFSLINFGRSEISIFWPIRSNKEKYVIKRDDLQDVELLLNVSNSKNIVSNMKFTKSQKISILANNIKNPFSLDLREASNHQFNMGNKWIMNVYDVSNSAIKGGKDTSGYYSYVNNKNTKISIHRFDKSKVECYLDPFGSKFEDSINANSR
jgi:hypothetical protein